MPDKKIKFSAKNKGGRPPLEKNQVRCVRLQPGFSIPEIEELEARAEALGITVIDWVRTAALGQQIKAIPSINRAAYIETAQLAGNLNQLSKKANEGITVGEQLQPLLNELYDSVQKLRAELCGGTRNG